MANFETFDKKTPDQGIEKPNIVKIVLDQDLPDRYIDQVIGRSKQELGKRNGSFNLKFEDKPIIINKKEVRQVHNISYTIDKMLKVKNQDKIQPGDKVLYILTRTKQEQEDTQSTLFQEYSLIRYFLSQRKCLFSIYIAEITEKNDNNFSVDLKIPLRYIQGFSN